MKLAAVSTFNLKIMRKVFLLVVLSLFIMVPYAQTDSTPAASLSHHIAAKMKDTLGLNNEQRAKVFRVNMDIYKDKSLARIQSSDRLLVGREIQHIERRRDSLYKAILREEQFLKYKEKKTNLVTAR